MNTAISSFKQKNKCDKTDAGIVTGFFYSRTFLFYPAVVSNSCLISPSFHHMLAAVIFGLKLLKFFTQTNCVILDEQRSSGLNIL